MVNLFHNYADLQSAIQSATFRFLPEYGPAEFVCCDCGRHIPLNTSGQGCGTGYGTNADHSEMFCYECGGKRTARDLERDGKGYLYLSGFGKPSEFSGASLKVGDWTGTLAYPVLGRRHGSHNIARDRYDVWFRGPDGFIWHGVQFGNNSRICRVRRTKAKDL